MIDKKELDKFAENMIKVYKNTSILKEIGQVIDYSEDVKGNFFQIGERVSLPKEFFEVGNTYDNTVLAEDFAKSIVLGEKNFIINHLIKLAKTSSLPFVEIKEFSYPEIVQNSLKNVNKPTDIFIPIDLYYYNEVHDWLYKRNAEYKDSELFIFIGSFKVKVHWSSKFNPFNDIVILNKDNIRIVQKKFENILIPKELGKPIYKYSMGEPLRLDFTESKKINEFDFYFRSVIAIDAITEKSVAVIELPKL